MTWVVAGMVVVAVAGAAAWWFWLRDGDDAAAQPVSTTQTVAASLSTLEKSVTATGTLTPTVQEDVSFEVSGTVTSVLVAAGQVVTAGQPLATVDTLTLNADLLEAKASLAKAEAKLSDAEDDDDGTTTSDAQIAAAKAQVDVAQAGVDTAQENMDDATLVAPVAGLLTSVSLEVGQSVTGSGSSSGVGAGAGGMSGGTSSTASTAQFVIIGTDSWDVDVTVDETDVALIAVGNQVEMTSDDMTGTVYGVVSEIGLISTSTSGVAAYPVVVTVTGDPDDLHDGVSMDVSIIYERRTDVLTVPSLAVTTVDGATVVTQLDADGNEVTVPVETGETSGDVIEILSGIAEGDEVVLTVFQAGGGNGDDGSDQTQDRQMPDGFQPPDGFQMPEGGQMPGGGQMGGGGNG
ncbi:efflux RND transporter periplasmic adaptor subunit [Cellulomonas sp. P22]|uniref:efflux RND transporter periplasmic adaptor subunit n=1 Tax=Cellulomonas sp. P22 TaxID=3373189 RepID=UPI003789C245